MDEIRFSDSCRYPAGSTFTPQTRDNPFTADANTVLLIHSDYTGGLGADSSGNYNHFTATNLVATDQMIDTPTNNFATFNALIKSYSDQVTYSEGNLKAAAGAEWGASVPTQSRVSGKWYFEGYFDNDSATRYAHIGICGDNNTEVFGGAASSPTGTSEIMYYGNNGYKVIDGTATSYGDTYGDGDIIGVAVNLDDSEVTFYKNNVAQNSGTAISFSGNITSAGSVIPLVIDSDIDCTLNAGQDSSFAGAVTAQGNQDGNEKGDFYYAPPTDYLALCTDNLSAPEIALPGKHFNTVLYTGNGSDATAITGADFEPGMIWIKNRSGSPDTPDALADQVRGADNILQPPTTELQFNDSAFIQSFDSDGFTIGTNSSVNTSSKNYASWNWKAGGAPTADNVAGVGSVPTAGSVKIDGANSTASALAGSIAATRISANTTAGFSIVQYDGNATSGATVSHGLSEAPAFV